MAKGKKTEPKTIYAIMASYAITSNFNETSRILNIPVATVKKIVDKHKDEDEFKKLCIEKRNEFSEIASRIMFKGLVRLEQDIDNEEKDIPVNQLTTMVGTLFDKCALSEGKSTENVKVEIKLPDGIEEYGG